MTGAGTGMAVLAVQQYPIAPAWAVALIAVPTLLLLAGHVLAVRKAVMPASRKRIRLFNGVLMMVTLTLAALAMGAVAPSQTRAFVIVWMLAMGGLVMVLAIAVLDAVNTVRLSVAHRRHMREALAQARAESGGSGNNAETAPS